MPHEIDPLVPFTPMRKPLGLVLAGCLALAACGGSGSSSNTTVAKGKVNPKYADFCLTASELDAQSNATHGEDPNAMSDPEKMEAAWKTIIESSQKLFDAAPLVVKSDIKKMLEGMSAMNKIYATYKYNLAEMKGVEKVATDLNAIANDTEISAASKHFKTWMADNCAL